MPLPPGVYGLVSDQQAKKCDSFCVSHVKSDKYVCFNVELSASRVIYMESEINV